MPPKEPIWCFVTGGETVFSVNRIESWSVYDLKEAMKAKKPQDLGATDANNLKLYLAEVDGSIDKQGRIDELKRLSRNLSECTELDEEHQLSGIFGEIPEGKKYYALMQLLEGKLVAAWAVNLSLWLRCPHVVALLTLWPINCNRWPPTSPPTRAKTIGRDPSYGYQTRTPLSFAKTGNGSL
jgi:hypothetical protein